MRDLRVRAITKMEFQDGSECDHFGFEKLYQLFTWRVVEGGWADENDS